MERERERDGKMEGEEEERKKVYRYTLMNRSCYVL